MLTELLGPSFLLVSKTPTVSTIPELCRWDLIQYTPFMCLLNLSNGVAFKTSRHLNRSGTSTTWSSRRNSSMHSLVPQFSFKLDFKSCLNSLIFHFSFSIRTRSFISALLYPVKKLTRSGYIVRSLTIAPCPTRQVARLINSARKERTCLSCDFLFPPALLSAPSSEQALPIRSHMTFWKSTLTLAPPKCFSIAVRQAMHPCRTAFPTCFNGFCLFCQCSWLV